MEDDSTNNGKSPEEVDAGSEGLPKTSEDLGNDSEGDSENERIFRNLAERTEEHAVTVRDAAKIFEKANLPVTERTIINWCNPNKRGVVRLDCYFDEGDGKYFITPETIQQLIKEQSPGDKVTQHIPFNSSESHDGISEPIPSGAEQQPKISEEVPKDSETDTESFGSSAGESMGSGGDLDQLVRQLRQRLIDEKILNKGKDYFIEQLQKDRQVFVGERAQLVEQMVLQGERVGKLETELRQLQAPRKNGDANRQTPDHFENDGKETSQREGWQAR